MLAGIDRLATAASTAATARIKPGAGSLAAGQSAFSAGGRCWRPWALVAAGGLVAQVGNLARPSGIVVCLALVAAALATPLIRRQPKGSWRPLAASMAAAALALGCYFAAGAATSSAIAASGVNPAGAANNLPEWKFVFGLQGTYDQGRQDLVEIGAYGPAPNSDARQIARRAVERDIRQLPRTWRSVLDRQINSLWVLNESGSYLYWPSFSSHYRYEVPSSGEFSWGHYLVLAERGLFLPIVILAAADVWLINRRRHWTALAAFLACFVIAFAAIHLVIEVQPRYRYLVMPAVFALTSPTWAWLTTRRRHLRLRHPKPSAH
ncbi:MAG: hypothetical protein LBG11_07290 [Bifidobacteriaceae bacterium]|nr:hypothetical protein [Bifidobacteriaceae bacterium]